MGSLSGPLPDPSADAGYSGHPQRVGFFTDTSVCIGCKACEVACKEWNALPAEDDVLTGMSYDNTGSLGASTYRHVAFVEQRVPARAASPVDLGMPVVGGGTPEEAADAVYLFCSPESNYISGQVIVCGGGLIV